MNGTAEGDARRPEVVDRMSVPRPQRYTVAHVLPFPGVGGVEHATLRIARATGSEHFRHVMFHREDGATVRDFFTQEGFETIAYQAIEPSYSKPAGFLRSSWQVARHMRQLGVDLIHCEDHLSGHYLGLAGRLTGRPVLCHIRNRNREISRRDQSFLRPIHSFVFVSQDTWDTFAYRVPAAQGRVVYDGIDAVPAIPGVDAQRREQEEVRREFGLPGDVKIVGMVARVAPQKDHQTLVRAAARMTAHHPQVRFLIVGEHSGADTYREQYRKVRELIAAHRLEPYFVFTDFRADVPRLLRAMDVFVLATHFEGLPLVILEAMANAKPVLATAVDGVPEAVEDGVSGLLHAHEDDDVLAGHLLRVLGDEAYARQLGAAARARVASTFTKEQFGRGMTQLYADLLHAPWLMETHAPAYVAQGY